MLAHPLSITCLIWTCFSASESSPSTTFIKCFECVSADGNCREGECTGSACYKSIKTTGHQWQRSDTAKGCKPARVGVEIGLSDTCQETSVSGKTIRLCTCLTDFCNKSDGRLPNVTVVILLPILTVSSVLFGLLCS